MEEGQAKEERVIVSFDIGIKNLACCVLGVGGKDRDYANVLVWKIISLAAPKEKIPAMQELSLRLFLELDELMHTLEKNGHSHIDTVLIENQPSRLNGSMKSIQMIIYSYFQLRRHWEGRVGQTMMISASGKLQGHTYEAENNAKTGYELNKWKAVKIAECYIGTNSQLQTVFESYKKKDDMSDALLQSVAWLRKHSYKIERVCPNLCV
jgi:hypothetical protein